MATSNDKLQKMELRQNYQNLWHTDLMHTVTQDPPYCCFSCICGPCVSYLLRKRALYNDMSRYVCCAGYMPCSGKCGESKCPEICLATEGFMFCLSQLACIFSLVACIVGSDELQEASQILNLLADLVYCTVCACMQTQHKVEMDKRDGKFGPQPMAVPPHQQMSRIDQPYPATVGYPPQQQAYGYPPQGYPPPQGQGYPPPQGQGYPAGGYPPPAYNQGHYPPPTH
ncbi:plac8 family protein [Citrus sinensis]|nr:plac8 family protein [Citrus sinensis]